MFIQSLTSNPMPRMKMPVSSDTLVSIATLPVLCGLIGLRHFQKMTGQLGLASEEIFRGERLPFLDSLARLDHTDEG